MAQKKLAVGFFSFTADEGCMIEFLEILNKYYFDWAKVLDVKYCKQLKSKNDFSSLDVAFVEGCIGSDSEVEKLKEIRANSKYLVSIGTCAISGQPSNLRNFFDEEKKKEVQFIVERFKLLPIIKAPPELVKIDDMVPGCPMVEAKFVEVLNKYLGVFGVVPDAQ